MEFVGVCQFRWHEQFHGIPWNSMELQVRQFRWHEQFNGIHWNFDDTSSSMEFHGTRGAPNSLTGAVPWNYMEFHGTWSAPNSLTRAVPWKSMEIGLCHFRWHEQFHWIPWNKECANFADTSSSMEFHGIWSAPISLTREVSWNYMELHGTCGIWIRSAPISLTREVPWISMELEVRQFRWHKQFHGIPWNLECANFADTSSSMEFHGTWNAPIPMTRAVPWNSLELGMRQFRWQEQFHGIPCNFGCANFADASSSMEFYWILWNLECANFADMSSSMEFHGARSALISLTRAVPWNSM